MQITEHVTLFQGTFSHSRINEVFNLLKIHADLSPLVFYLDKTYSIMKHKIYLSIRRNKQLYNLYVKILKIISPLKLRTLKRVYDDYSNLSPLEQKIADKSGTNNVLEQYNPHMTIFYQYSGDYNSEVIAKKFASDLVLTICHAAKLAIVELGYDGNVINILHSLDFK